MSDAGGSPPESFSTSSLRSSFEKLSVFCYRIKIVSTCYCNSCYEKNPKYFKVYDEEWGIWVVVEKYPKVDCDYVALYDKETMDGMIERHPFVFK